jgi:hypothetical protein
VWLKRTRVLPNVQRFPKFGMLGLKHLQHCGCGEFGAELVRFKHPTAAAAGEVSNRLVQPSREHSSIKRPSCNFFIRHPRLRGSLPYLSLRVIHECSITALGPQVHPPR